MKKKVNLILTMGVLDAATTTTVNILGLVLALTVQVVRITNIRTLPLFLLIAISLSKP